MMEGAKSGVTLAISLAGPICLWSGVSKAMDAVGWSAGLARLLEPLLRRLFPAAWADREAREALCGNLSANLLGLGNAATPLGIRAARRMALDANGAASDELCRLVVMNTASIQLLPTTVAAVRQSAGSAAPFDILPCVWISSLLSVSVGLLAVFLLGRVWRD
jgi:spore maturation protein A